MISSRFRTFAIMAAAVAAGISTPARSELLHPMLDAIAVSIAKSHTPPEDRAEVVQRTADALRQAVIHKSNADPEWLVRGTGVAPLEYTTARPGQTATYVALQLDRLDGMDLLTVRRSLKSVGKLQLFAGAGLGRARYLDDGELARPLPTRRAQHCLGTAAEVGARAELGARVSVEAALRWAQLGRDAALLQSDSGLTNADPVMLGVTVAYRFH